MKVILVLLFFTFLAGCEEESDLQRIISSEKVKISGSFLTENPEELRFPVKLIFAIDQSDSMGNGSDTPGADPFNKRIELALEYIDELDQFDNFEFNVMLWSGSNNKAYPNNTSFAKDASEIPRSIVGNTNEGVTKYLVILEEIKNLVREECPSVNDREENLAGLTNCMVIFFTDGLPTDNDFDGRSQEYIRNKLSEDVVEIRDIAFRNGIGDFTFNTIFLNPPGLSDDEVNNAENLLRVMANAGGGTFTSFENASEINFENYDFRIAVEYEIKNVIAYNYMARGGLDDAGEQVLLIDSDGDGLTDIEEARIGTDPTQYDTDADALGDFFEYRQNLIGNEGLNPLIANNENDIGFGVDCQSDRGFFNDSDLDFLTDCEEVLLAIDSRHVDDDRDFFPDSIELMTNSQVDRETNIQDSDFDGIFDVEEIRNHTPLDLNAPRLQSKYAYQTDHFSFETIRINEDLENSSVLRNYQFEISNIDIVETQEITDSIHRLLPFYNFLAGDNLICLWVVQAPVRTDAIEPIYTRACKVVNYYNNPEQLIFSEQDFSIFLNE